MMERRADQPQLTGSQGLSERRSLVKNDWIVSSGPFEILAARKKNEIIFFGQQLGKGRRDRSWCVMIASWYYNAGFARHADLCVPG